MWVGLPLYPGISRIAIKKYANVDFVLCFLEAYGIIGIINPIYTYRVPL